MAQFSDITEAESAALEALYTATTGASWTDNTNWDGATAGDCYGVTVAGGVVTALDLRANNLDGEFTSAVVAALTSCTDIHVEGNPSLNVSFNLDHLPASVTELHCSDTDSSMGGGVSAMSAVAIEKILARRASLSSGSVADIVDRIYADRASFTHASSPKLDIGNTYAYGVIWDSDTDTYQIGVVYNGVFTEQAIDEFPVHEMMRRCVLDDAGVRQYYLLSTDSTKKAANGAAATLDGTDGQVMVELYKFWSIKKHYGTKRYMFVSDGPFSITMPDSSVVTAVIHPVFYAGQATPTERVYCGAYQAAMYDDSASAMMGTVHTDLYAAGDKLCSVSGYYPKTNETIIEFRAAAAARGAGWHQLDAPMWHALQMLFVTRYGTLNSQDAIGMGRTNLWGGVWEAGSYIGICGRSNAVGNASGNQSLGGTDGHAGDYMAVLGIEDFWGNVWQWLDGANVHNSAGLGSRLFLCDDYELYASDTDTNYTYAGDLAASDGWVTDFVDADGFWPASIGGSDNSYLCDYYYTYFDDDAGSGWRVARVGGSAINWSMAGAFFVDSYNGSANAHAYVGGRLCYTKKET